MSKVLIIKPSFKPYNAFPVGMAYVLACLEKNDIEFDFIDLERSANWIGEVKEQLKHNSYYAVATGGLIGSYVFFQQLTTLIRKHHFHAPVILGGNIVKDSSDDLLFKTIGIDCGVLGEAEACFPQLLNAIRNKESSFEDIPGIVFRNKSGEIIRNKQTRCQLEEINYSPAWHSFDMDYYINKIDLTSIGERIRYMPVLTGRGCTGQCAFCSPSIGGFRKRPISDVLAEITELNAKYDFELIHFYNEMFYPNIKGIREFCQQYMAKGHTKPWSVAVRVDSDIDVDTFSLMKRAGCVEVFAGIESGSERILEKMRKHITPDQIRRFFKNAKNAGMPAGGQFIIGYEDEAEEDIKNSIDLVIDGDINTDASLMYVYPGTEVYRNACEKGLIKNELEHLERITRLATSLYSPYVKKEFFNLTALSTSEFVDIAIRELRRYKTFMFKQHAMKNLACAMELDGPNIEMHISGNCRNCGHEIEYKYDIVFGMEYQGILGLGFEFRLLCPECLTLALANIYDSGNRPKLAEHYRDLKKKLSSFKRILLTGINQDTLFLLKINLFNLDYKNIIGVYDSSGDFTADDYVSFPVISRKNLKAANPDCILLLDPTVKVPLFRKLLPNTPELFLVYDNFLVELKELVKKVNSSNNRNKFIWYFTRKARKYFHRYRPFVNKMKIKFPLFAEVFESLKSKYYSSRGQ